MNSQNILYSKGNNDECYTPRYAVEPLLKYIPLDLVIWCPFDTEDSEYVKLFEEKGYKVIKSHISNNQNFYEYEPEEHWDIIISNPPFTNKRKIFERAISFNKPFMLLMSNTWLNDSAPKQIFKNKQLQLLMFEQRIKFINQGKVNNKITFSSSYYCYGKIKGEKILPNDIVMESLKIK